MVHLYCPTTFHSFWYLMVLSSPTIEFHKYIQMGLLISYLSVQNYSQMTSLSADRVLLLKV